jgi:hypothetical protein
MLQLLPGGDNPTKRHDWFEGLSELTGAHSVHSLTQMVEDCVSSTYRWAVVLSFNSEAYRKMDKTVIQKTDGGNHFPETPEEYISLQIKNEAVAVALAFHNLIALHFDRQVDAEAFFEKVPTGSLVYAELMAPTGASIVTNKDPNTIHA